MRHQTSQASVASRQERAASRILDDESLRGDLADDEFQPVLDWALGVTDLIASATGNLDDDAAQASIDDGIQAIREVTFMVQEVIGAHAEGGSFDRRSALDVIGSLMRRDKPIALDEPSPEAIRRRLTALADRLDAEPDLPGSDVTSLIVAALSSGEVP